ncbi:nuclear polyadenylated RNA-binding protein NAB2 [Rhizophagus clarus]|uniref:Nuclear polyadenylated RNA-binding protein NAB2 n=1 Tax=Rhizophagus clarus TaxID=94130 RepID=A0A8H3QPJ8_9GLOM|nr:nuclear polyadenylated RNA-binding protein NAB2 [Rhizophagus clarus]
MYTNEAIESQRVRSVVGSVNGKPIQRRTGGNNSTATSRLFMNAVKDASKGVRNPGERTEENVSHRSDKGHSKRPYSPTMDYNKEDQKIKSRKVENGSEYDRSFESDRSQDRYLRVGTDRRPSDQGLYMPSPPDYERNRYGSSAASTNAMPFPSDSNNNITLTPKTSRCRHWPNCDLGSACKFHHPIEICPMVPNCPNSPKTCLYIHPANQDFASYDQRGGIYTFGNNTGQGAFDPRSSGLSSFGLGPMGPMGHGIFGQGTSYQNGAFGTGVFVQNSQRPSTTFGKGTSEQGLSVQNQQKEEKSNVVITESVNSATSATAKSNDTLSGHEKDASSQQVQIQKPVPNAPPAVSCKFSENCANPNCMYAHASPASTGTGSIPSTLIDIPCKFGSECAQPKCRYSHPSPATVAVSQEPCRYYPNCQNPVCPYLHIDYSNTMKVPTPCRNGAHCARPGCHFMHPWDIESDTSNIPCKFGFNCRRPDCAYAHPMGKKNYSHISERTFAVPEEMTEKVLPPSENQENKKDDEPVKSEEIKNELNNNKSENKEDKNKSNEVEEEFNEEDFNWDLDFDVDVILNDEGINGDVVTDL